MSKKAPVRRVKSYCMDCSEELTNDHDIYECLCHEKLCGCRLQQHFRCETKGDDCYNIVCSDCIDDGVFFTSCLHCRLDCCAKHFGSGALCKECEEDIHAELRVVQEETSVLDEYKLKAYARKKGIKLGRLDGAVGIRYCIQRTMLDRLRQQFGLVPAAVVKNEQNPPALLRKPVTSKKDDVASFRDKIDLYTGRRLSKVLKPEVDHIVEDQVMASAAYQALKNEAYKSDIIDGLKDCLNPDTLLNYNVCNKSLNIKKGSVTKEFLKYAHTSSSVKTFEPLALSMFGDKIMTSLSGVMNETYPVIIDGLREKRRNSHIGSEFEKIGVELGEIFASMDLTDT